MFAVALAPVLIAAAATIATVAPSELLPAVPAAGWERDDLTASADGTDLTFGEYAELQPDSVAHIDPESEVAGAIVASIDVWGRDGEFLVTEVVRSPDADVAESFVDQAAAIAIAEGLAATEPPFEGAWSYEGPVEAGWTRIVSWSYGPYSVTMTQLSVDERGAAELTALAGDQAALVVARVTSPPVPTTAPSDPAADGSGSAWPIVLIGSAALVGVIALLVVRRRRAAATPAAADETDVDAIIERARRGRTASSGGVAAADADGDGISDVDEMIARARARAEVDRLDGSDRELDPDH